jgi:hypothetical protein
MININDVENCLNMVYTIMTNCTDVYEHKIVKKEYPILFKPSKKKYDYNSTFNGFTDYYTPKETNMNDDKWDGWSYDGKKYSKSYSEEVGECWHCGIETLESSLTKDGLCSYCKTYHQDCSVPF